ncbi:MAG: PLP-dependent aminotransferase family protein [Acidobacteriota bacterium]|nr:PLP-dependent aminotransferase family protein [Acidobacteriota bacterium]
MTRPVDFSVGLTDPACFPTEELAEAAARAIREIGDDFIFYPGGLGHLGLREILAARESKRESMEIPAEHVALFNGSMQAVTLVARVLMEKSGDAIVTEELTYSGTINAYKGLGARLVGVPVDEHGMRVDVLDRTLSQLEADGSPAKFVYALPTYQNPTGTVMPLERRRELLEVARSHQILVVEDNCYGDVHFDGDIPPSIYSLAEPGEVLYICSLSKIFAAGLRLGYMVGPPQLLEPIVDKRFDAGHSVLSAAIASAFLDGHLWDHVEMHNASLRQKRDALVEGLETHSDLWQFVTPVGGLFLWLELPQETDIDLLHQLGAQRGVISGRGCNFHIHGDEIPYVRLAFGFPTVEEITRAIPILAECVREAAGLNLQRASL